MIGVERSGSFVVAVIDTFLDAARLIPLVRGGRTPDSIPAFRRRHRAKARLLQRGLDRYEQLLRLYWNLYRDPKAGESRWPRAHRPEWFDVSSWLGMEEHWERRAQLIEFLEAIRERAGRAYREHGDAIDFENPRERRQRKRGASHRAWSKLSPRERAILDHLQAEPLQRKGIARRLSLPESAIKRDLARLSREGFLRNRAREGYWVAALPPGAPFQLTGQLVQRPG